MQRNGDSHDSTYGNWVLLLKSSKKKKKLVLLEPTKKNYLLPRRPLHVVIMVVFLAFCIDFRGMVLLHVKMFGTMHVKDGYKF